MILSLYIMFSKKYKLEDDIIESFIKTYAKKINVKKLSDSGRERKEVKYVKNYAGGRHTRPLLPEIY